MTFESCRSRPTRFGDGSIPQTEKKRLVSAGAPRSQFTLVVVLRRFSFETRSGVVASPIRSALFYATLPRSFWKHLSVVPIALIRAERIGRRPT
ncbi:hypothetical protein TNCV_1740111 [Trichonephila clavipes]|nr:hypothetical protein TNCV_1740111 [Trichonephila clavipes]